MPIHPKSGGGRWEAVISPEHLRTRMNCCLLLSSSLVSGGICCFFRGRAAVCIMLDLVPQTRTARQSGGKQQQLPARVGEPDPGSILGSGGKQTTGDVSVLAGRCQRAMARGRDADVRRCRDTVPPATQGSALCWRRPEGFSSSTAATHSHSREHLNCSSPHILNLSKRLVQWHKPVSGTFFQLNHHRTFLSLTKWLSHLDHNQYSKVLTILPS